MFPGLDLYYAAPALPITTAGEELDDLDHDLSDICLSELSRLSTSWSIWFICPRCGTITAPHARQLARENHRRSDRVNPFFHCENCSTLFPELACPTKTGRTSIKGFIYRSIHMNNSVSATQQQTNTNNARHTREGTKKKVLPAL